MTALDEILARCEAATPGEWVSVCSRENDHYGVPTKNWTVYTEYTVPEGSVNNLAVASGYGGLSDGFARVEHAEANADFIAHSRTDIPRLVEAVEYLLDELPSVHDAREEVERILRGGK